jgi:hypothetical protein
MDRVDHEGCLHPDYCLEPSRCRCGMALTRVYQKGWACVCCDYATPRDPCPH